jgi:hypothetical protein
VGPVADRGGAGLTRGEHDTDAASPGGRGVGGRRIACMRGERGGRTIHERCPDTGLRGKSDRPVPGRPAGSGTNFVDSEVEPWLATDPSDPLHMVGAWQQDRWSNGGSRGDVSAASFHGGQTWTIQEVTRSTTCTGGRVANGGNYERASDPWVAISPDGTTYLMTLSVDTNPGGFGTSPNAMLVMRSQDGGLTWENPTTLKRDENPNVLNDKNSMTADPHDPDFAYAIWDRLVSPPGEGAPPIAFDNALGFKGPTWFSRTTDGGESWEPARKIFDPAGENQRLETRSWSPRAATWSTPSI